MVSFWKASVKTRCSFYAEAIRVNVKMFHLQVTVLAFQGVMCWDRHELDCYQELGFL